MEVSQVLAELENIKNQYQLISKKYGDIYYGGDCQVYIGSQMWYDEVFKYGTELYRRDYFDDIEVTDEIAIADHKQCVNLIREAEGLLKLHKLDKLLIDGGVMYWIGALPEPYTSAY